MWYTGDTPTPEFNDEANDELRARGGSPNIQ